ncbi:hypothetical protein A3G67_00695 [Candidatus Roizmanbacteria bacterium RIFCSPLOWO2_12_FULL_40_12]|uniref:GGDEF domain-containing protein n=1 Tax=Candidatus Roizmanbacteria bacterium RIFCSPLOWO2_01_FULL_40_42 TaxID=1802066 RepID=A0A1F7J2A2_9BACT|nr:MAG: hypothetical protein A2779_03585 [Candidatus Roizmanbacteria bacterium RIFCSPHIGHO2_01_FULL_40_98]OGK28568.1 MAG: hypothetical protein A3C31_03060 [Candidatus Roizmanbacteria bacterium RIFCSPHIGHO2_02_FULL_40_53]OGK29347.1 MAG: hypothetical protein A2W49_00495 [Candidatus Roizmanbacteria bacterium RIFCSPHIGHO2_12_41_18]OGK36718.1 MAG: hypothetical protein A3E69_00230 [Candidatus Roizmanbacteria bacterium RIFCSPHIGHO2_12_FULL_40_130]OGK49734.1 MAG: hypothetical protein A3B50_03410 [Candi
MTDAQPPEQPRPDTEPATPSYILLTQNLPQILPRRFKDIAQREHLKPDDLANIYQDDPHAKHLIAQQVLRKFPRESSEENLEPELEEGVEKQPVSVLPSDWIYVSGYLHDINKIRAELGEEATVALRRWGPTVVAERIEKVLAEAQLQYATPIIMVTPEGRRDEFDCLIGGLPEDTIVKIKEQLNSAVEAEVEFGNEGKGEEKGERIKQVFESSIGVVSSIDTDDLTAEIFNNIKAKIATGGHPDPDRVTNYLRRRMLISRLEFERTVDGRSLVHTNAAEEQRESISQILTDDLERSVAEDKDLNTSLLEAKRRLNAEIIQGIALDAVQREKKGRLVAEKETNQAREESLTDSLTGLPNRRFLLGDEGETKKGKPKRTGELQRIFAEAKRMDHGLTALFIDFDNFKEVNDKYGEVETGDPVLKAVSKKLRDTLREADLLIRFGGEELVALLPESEKLPDDQLIALIERLNEAVSITELPYGIKQTISIGVASFPDGALDDPLELLRRANDAEHEAKRRGRNQFAIWNRKTPRIATLLE